MFEPDIGIDLIMIKKRLHVLHFTSLNGLLSYFKPVRTRGFRDKEFLVIQLGSNLVRHIVLTKPWATAQRSSGRELLLNQGLEYFRLFNMLFPFIYFMFL